MRTEPPQPGQRWVSDSEPELGLGIILKAEFGRVEVLFPAASETRQYALKTAPLRRVEFKEGDRIKLHGGAELLVEAVELRKGLRVYLGTGREATEAELSDTISFSSPEERLLAGQVDELRTYDLRVAALTRRSELRQSPVRGFVGGRVDLLPHQMFIAGEVASRLLPRVLLADEVGLGKTIEAGLILHRLHLTGRAERVLILVPEPLLHQWFVELLRRFNLLFSLFDEERCESLTLHNPDANPFLDSQLVLCGVEFLSADPERTAQVIAAGWDLLVVDEAHHLEWSPQSASPQYLLVESLARQTNGLLLLTATPQQLGPEGHFARLRLLDPDRYSDLARFLAEAEHYERVAQMIDRVLGGKKLTKAERALFAANSPHLRLLADAVSAGDEAARAPFIAGLLDEFGTGRVMFRNTRSALAGFPKRRAHLVALDAAADPIDVRIKWLVQLLKKLGSQKILLICRTRELAEDLHTRLLRELNVAAGLFHEGLSLLQRDRNAAYFAEEDGARILLCSEIGSEGRNFQFAHHLVLFDLPENPELVEQRIGRLDRIGQTATINIHVPFQPGTASEVLARWYHEGLGAFERNVHGAAAIWRELSPELSTLQETFDAKPLTLFLKKTQQLRDEVVQQLARGHDRLLELHSCRPDRAASIIAEIRTLDESTAFEEFFIGLLDHFGVHVEELGQRTYLLRPGHLRAEALPGLPEDGLTATFARARALSREDLGFLSPDHPLVRGTLDLLLGTESGNCAFGLWKQPGAEGIFLELHAVVECIAPAELHADRFLPPTPLRMVVDHALVDHTADEMLRTAVLEKGDIFRLLDRGAVKKKLLPAMLAKAQEMAATQMTELAEKASSRMEQQLGDELARLEDLRTRNDHIRPEEVATLQEQRGRLHQALAAARLRVDALRLIFRCP